MRPYTGSGHPPASLRAGYSPKDVANIESSQDKSIQFKSPHDKTRQDSIRHDTTRHDTTRHGPARQYTSQDTSQNKTG